MERKEYYLHFKKKILLLLLQYYFFPVPRVNKRARPGHKPYQVLGVFDIGGRVFLSQKHTPTKGALKFSPYFTAAFEEEEEEAVQSNSSSSAILLRRCFKS